MKERLNALKLLLEENLGDSYSDQYGICDFLEGNKALTDQMDKLSAESAFYQDMLRQLTLITFKLK